jgi:hypothetical protein
MPLPSDRVDISSAMEVKNCSAGICALGIDKVKCCSGGVGAAGQGDRVVEEVMGFAVVSYGDAGGRSEGSVLDGGEDESASEERGCDDAPDRPVPAAVKGEGSEEVEECAANLEGC